MNTKKTVQIFAVALLCLSIVTISYGEYTNRRKEPISYHLTQEQYDPIHSLTEAEAIVESRWSLPEEALTIVSNIKKEEQLDEAYWTLNYYDGDEYLLRVKLETDTGCIVSLTDHRYEGTENNVKDEQQVLAIASDLFNKMGVDASNLPEPYIHPPHKTGDAVFNEYTVLYNQYYKGLPVLGGFIRTRINAEALVPVGYTNALIDIGDIDVTPKISKDSATKSAQEYLKTVIVQQKDYSGFKVIRVDLLIGRVHYHPYEDRVVVPMGEPQLMWYVTAKGLGSRELGIMVDALSNDVIGINEER